MSTERGLINLLFGAVKRPDRRSVKLFDGAYFKTLLSNTSYGGWSHKHNGQIEKH